MTGPATAATSRGPGTRTRSSQPNQTITREELLNANQALRSVEQARAVLEKNKWVEPGENPNTEALSTILLQISQNVQAKILQEGTRAIAILMTEEVAQRVGIEIAKYVKTHMAPLVEKAKEVTEHLTSVTESVQKATEEALKQREAAPATQGADTQFTYATALKGNVPFSHPNTLARARARECQLLIDKDPNAETNGLENLTELELVAKANEAVTNAGSWPREEDSVFVGAKRLANGGILFDMDGVKAAEWAQKNKQQFLENFSATSIVKDRAVSVIAEYVPVNYSPEAFAELRKVERDSKIVENSIIMTRWIKPPLRRSENQRSAHLIVRFSNTDAANKAIRDGMIFAGKRVWARRLKKEPRRCLKCQKIDTKHMAAACKSRDVCGTCGKEHRTAECPEDDPANYHCANCDKPGHASWDRTCPKFMAACERIENNDPENSYKFFPKDDPWTWEQRGHHAGGQDARDLLNDSRRIQNRNQDRDQDPQPAIQRLNDWYERGNLPGKYGHDAGRNFNNPNPQVGTNDDGWNRDENHQATINQYLRPQGDNNGGNNNANGPPEPI